MARTTWIRRLIVCCALGFSITHAQTTLQPRLPRQITLDRTGIQGLVRTVEGAGIPQVTITLNDAISGREYQFKTEGDGVFRNLNIPPGTYKLQTRADNFAPLDRDQVVIQPGRVTELELQLKRILTQPAVPRSVVEPGAPDQSPRVVGSESLPPRYPVLTEATQSTVGADLPTGDLPVNREPVFSEIPNRWGEDYPPGYRRYNLKGEYPVTRSHFLDPFDRSKLKGDIPIVGNRTFLNLTLISDTFAEGRKLPTPTNISTDRPDSSGFFGHSGQFFTDENLTFSIDLFHGDAAFRPIDWRIRVTPEVNVNYLLVQELGIVSPDPRRGDTRLDSHAGLQEAFFEAKLLDLTHDYDFVSVRAGIQGFNSDFRGFIFNDEEPGIRLFGNLQGNRYQYNLAAFSMLEKDTNSGLNSFAYRSQQVYLANLFRQDFFTPGYTVQVSFHYDKDDPSTEYDTNGFLVRPEPVGRVKPHAIRAYYYGLTGDGHIGRINVNHAFYEVIGHDTFNPIAGRAIDIQARMAALELSLDRNWIRYRISAFYSSGDHDPRGRHADATGFDSIFDNPDFSGGMFSFWNREGIRLLGSSVALVNADSLVPDLRSSKIQGQANFVNPGIFIYNASVDAEVTPKLRGFFNLNFVRFDKTEPLEFVLFQKPIHAGVGADSGIGIRYRPPLSENIVLTAGFNAFFPFEGFRQIYTGRTLFAAFADLRFRF